MSILYIIAQCIGGVLGYGLLKVKRYIKDQCFNILFSKFIIFLLFIHSCIISIVYFISKFYMLYFLFFFCFKYIFTFPFMCIYYSKDNYYIKNLLHCLILNDVI